jgi:hypothetical protein
MHEEIIKIIDNAQTRFKEWLDRYKPWHADNGITERNLSFQFATSFLSLNQNGLVFMEVPFAATPGGPCRYHLDAYLHSDEFDLLLECKIVFAPSHIRAIAADIARMKQELLLQINERHGGTKPSKTYGVVLAETWNREIAEWWRGNKEMPKWSRDGLPDKWHYDFIKVTQVIEKTEWNLFWLYGISPEWTVLPNQTENHDQ